MRQWANGAAAVKRVVRAEQKKKAFRIAII